MSLSLNPVDKQRALCFPSRGIRQSPANATQFYHDLHNYQFVNRSGKSQSEVNKYRQIRKNLSADAEKKSPGPNFHRDNFIFNGDTSEDYVTEIHQCLAESEKDLAAYKEIFEETKVQIPNATKASINQLIFDARRKSHGFINFEDSQNKKLLKKVFKDIDQGSSLSFSEHSDIRSDLALKKTWNLSEAKQVFLISLEGLFKTLDALIGIELKLEELGDLGQNLKEQVNPNLTKLIRDCTKHIDSLLPELSNKSKNYIEKKLVACSENNTFVEEQADFYDLVVEATLKILNCDRSILTDPNFSKLFDKSRIEDMCLSPDCNHFRLGGNEVHKNKIVLAVKNLIEELREKFSSRLLENYINSLPDFNDESICSVIDDLVENHNEFKVLYYLFNRTYNNKIKEQVKCRGGNSDIEDRKLRTYPSTYHALSERIRSSNGDFAKKLGF